MTTTSRGRSFRHEHLSDPGLGSAHRGVLRQCPESASDRHDDRIGELDQAVSLGLPPRLLHPDRRRWLAHVLTRVSALRGERRACQVIRADRKMIRYRSGRPADTALRARLRELAAEQRRFGYRRLHALLRHEGHLVNRKKTQRLYREKGLSVRRRRGRKRAMGARAPILIATRANARWSIDFVHKKIWRSRRDSNPRYGF